MPKILSEAPGGSSHEHSVCQIRYLPRHIVFLYSKNRLNVAVSRAKCLAIFIANPALMTIRCSTPEEMVLVNMLDSAGWAIIDPLLRWH